MRFKFVYLILTVLLSTIHLNLSAQNSSILEAKNLNPFGRYLRTADGHVELISSAASVGFSFKGTDCQVYAYMNDLNGHNYLQYEVDGVYQKRIRIEGTNKNPFTITVKGKGQHTVWIYKATEAHSGPIFIEKITGKSLMPLKRQEAPLIEFIGNSITCGAAADPSEVPCGTGSYHDQHNAYFAYGPRVARSLKANFMLSSVSGIGIYRTWNMDGPSMPKVYENADFQDGSSRPWNFQQYKPTVVSIALGTNDFSNGDGKHERAPFDSAKFVGEYIKFIGTVKSYYPSSRIALLSSPLFKGSQQLKLHHCLEAVKKSIDTQFPTDKPVALFFFKSMDAKGCTGHPNVEDHGILADELLSFFKDLL